MMKKLLCRVFGHDGLTMWRQNGCFCCARCGVWIHPTEGPQTEAQMRERSTCPGSWADRVIGLMDVMWEDHEQEMAYPAEAEKAR